MMGASWRASGLGASGEAVERWAMGVVEKSMREADVENAPPSLADWKERRLAAAKRACELAKIGFEGLAQATGMEFPVRAVFKPRALHVRLTEGAMDRVFYSCLGISRFSHMFGALSMGRAGWKFWPCAEAAEGDFNAPRVWTDGWLEYWSARLGTRLLGRRGLEAFCSRAARGLVGRWIRGALIQPDGDGGLGRSIMAAHEARLIEAGLDGRRSAAQKGAPARRRARL